MVGGLIGCGQKKEKKEMVRFFVSRCWFNRRVLIAGGPKEEKVWVLFWWGGMDGFLCFGRFIGG